MTDTNTNKAERVCVICNSTKDELPDGEKFTFLGDAWYCGVCATVLVTEEMVATENAKTVAMHVAESIPPEDGDYTSDSWGIN